MGSARLPSAFVDMLRSFVTLAETQNLSQTVELLGVSRQTVRRHVRELELARGTVFFEPGESRYSLTEAGKNAAEDAQNLIMGMAEWVDGIAVEPLDLHRQAIEQSQDVWFFA